MEKYKNYESFKNNVLEAKNWIKNKDNIDSQSHTKYSLNNISFSADYCGQSYAGANNYHKSPPIFNEYISKVIKNKFSELTEEVVRLLEKELNEMLIDAEDEILRIKEKIDSAKEGGIKHD